MDRRRILLVVAAVVALLGTALVFVYVKGADTRAGAQYQTVQVLKATQDIASGESYDQALSAGKVTLANVPQNQLAPGYQVAADGLKGKFAAQPIHAGEQVLTTMWGATVQTGNSSLAIPAGKMAISVNLTDPDRVAGNLDIGSQVAIFVTGKPDPNSDNSVTKLLLAKVTVLNVGSPQPTSTTKTSTDGSQTTEQLPRTLLTLAVDQEEAQKVIVSSKAAELTFAMLTDNSKTQNTPATSSITLFK
ncbi:MAG: Flp pilus assembly protein CpaB [Nocardioides sp.]